MDDPRQDITPHPDPTRLTTEQLTERLHAQRELIETRLDGMDKAISVLASSAPTLLTDIERQIRHLRELLEERFRGIERRFLDQAERVDEQKKDTGTATAAALQAQKEAANAQNIFTAKQIDGLSTLFNSNFAGISSQLSALTGRVDRGEGTGTGAATQKNEHRLDTGVAITAAVLVATIISLAIALIRHLQ